MLLAGDEFGRTQNGNNNAYCQDNEISWIDWSARIRRTGTQMMEFVARVIALRKNYPLLREMRFLFGDREVLPGLFDVGWFDEHGARSPSKPGRTPKAARSRCVARGQV